MTIKECIDIVDNLKPNQYSIEDKVGWLAYLDHSIIEEVLFTHEGYDGRYDDFTGYSADRLTEGLVVPSPYDRLYPAYLKMKIDEENGETARYNNSATLFNAYLMEYKKWYNKRHMPISPSDIRSLPALNPPYVDVPQELPRPVVRPIDVSEAQLEQLRKLLYAELHDDMLAEVSNDKIYAIVKNFMDTNQQMISNLTERIIASKVAQVKLGNAVLRASAWAGRDSLYSQVVTIDGVTKNSQVDLTPSVEQLAVFYEKDITFVTENDGGVVTVYAIGQKPQKDYTIQVTITEVDYE